MGYFFAEMFLLFPLNHTHTPNSLMRPFGESTRRGYGNESNNQGGRVSSSFSISHTTLPNRYMSKLYGDN